MFLVIISVVLTILGLAIAFIVHFYVNYFLTRSKKVLGLPQPPGPIPLPIVGNIPKAAELAKEDVTLDGLANLVAPYGDVVTVFLGPFEMVMINSIDCLKEAFVDQGNSLDVRFVTGFTIWEMTEKFSDVFTSNGPVWRDLRKVFMHGLIANHKLNYQLVQKETESFVKDIRSEGKDGDVPIEVRPIFKAQALKTICDISVGGCPPDPNDLKRFLYVIQEADNYVNIAHPRNMFPILKYFPNYEDRCRKMLKERNEILERIISDHEKSFDETHQRDFLDQLLLKVKEKELSRDNIRLMLVDTFIGGADTSSSTLEFLVGLLASHPETQRKAQEEVDRVLQGRPPTLEDLPALTYCDAVIKEVCRFRPVGDATGRMLTQDMKLGKYGVRKGIPIMLFMYNLHLREDLWKDARAFRPERFLEEEKDLKIRGSEAPTDPAHLKYVPFGIGKRSCAGLQLGRMQLYLQSIRLIQSFEWIPESPDGKIDMTLKTGLTSKTRHPVRVYAKFRGH
jgi:cytochrome P450